MNSFAEFFGVPEIKRVVMRDGQEEQLEIFGLKQAAQAIREAWERDTSDPHSASYGMPLASNTIDIDYEIVD